MYRWDEEQQFYKLPPLLPAPIIFQFRQYLIHTCRLWIILSYRDSCGSWFYGESTRLRHSRRDRLAVTQRCWRPLTHCCLQCNFPDRDTRRRVEVERDINALARDQGRKKKRAVFLWLDPSRLAYFLFFIFFSASCLVPAGGEKKKKRHMSATDDAPIRCSLLVRLRRPAWRRGSIGNRERKKKNKYWIFIFLLAKRNSITYLREKKKKKKTSIYRLPWIAFRAEPT